MPDEKALAKRLRLLRKDIGDIAYSTYQKYKNRGDKHAVFELLLGAADETSTILQITSEGKQQVLEQFGIIGSGQVTGGELLLTEFVRQDLNQSEAAALAALIVTRIGNIDMSVGGEPDIKWCRNGRVWHYKEFKFKNIMEQSKSRWNTLKKIWWKMQEGNNFKERLEKIL
jgi:hypothetical protein